MCRTLPVGNNHRHTYQLGIDIICLVSSLYHLWLIGVRPLCCGSGGRLFLIGNLFRREVGIGKGISFVSLVAFVALVSFGIDTG